MACPNREDDERILEAIALGKALKTQAQAAEAEPAESTVERHWEGSLPDIQFFGINLDDVISIHKTGTGRYTALIRQGC